MSLRVPRSNFRTLFLHSKVLSHLTSRSLASYLSTLESIIPGENGSKSGDYDRKAEMIDSDLLDISDRSSQIRSEQKIEIASIIAEATAEFFEKKDKFLKNLIRENFAFCKIKIERAINVNT